jgi:hypothetical protein
MFSPSTNHHTERTLVRIIISEISYLEGTTMGIWETAKHLQSLLQIVLSIYPNGTVEYLLIREKTVIGATAEGRSTFVHILCQHFTRTT